MTLLQFRTVQTLARIVTGGTRAIVPLFIALAVGTLAAQFTSGVSLVEAYATVVDRHGQAATGLRADDFQVLEDGEPQAITTFAAGEFPIAVAIAIDRSFSMAGDRLPSKIRAR